MLESALIRHEGTGEDDIGDSLICSPIPSLTPEPLSSIASVYETNIRNPLMVPSSGDVHRVLSALGDARCGSLGYHIQLQTEPGIVRHLPSVLGDSMASLINALSPLQLLPRVLHRVNVEGQEWYADLVYLLTD